MMSDLYSLFFIGDEIRKFSRPRHGTLYYKNKKIDLLNGLETSSDMEEIRHRFKQVSLVGEAHKPHIFHLYYELGYEFNGLDYLIKDDQVLAIEIIYDEDCSFELTNDNEAIHLEVLHKPSYQIYEKKFQEGYQALKRGDCYQFNLTCPYLFKIGSKLSLSNFIAKVYAGRKNRGDYAHLTFLGPLNKVLLSNSPECLFQVKKSKEHFLLETRPIKGSLALNERKDWQGKWKELLNDSKNETELSIITDLLRNDLSKIEKPLAEVIEERSPLIVPGILHQFARIRVQLSSQVCLDDIVKATFPGGSVTGAPKPRVLEILKGLEERERGFYCGSSIMKYRDTLSASINIRSAEIDLEKQTLLYQSGGGITLLSNAEEEFLEMEMKVNSLISLLTE